jgi:hypothetical protein
MDNLQKLYTEFSDYVLLNSNRIPDDIISRFVSSEERLEIYKKNVFQTLIDALKDNFPVITKLVGNEFFVYCAEFYICSYPPHTQSLSEYGDKFPEFLADFPPAKNLEYLADVAKLEIAFRKAYFADDLQSLNPENLAKLGKDALFVNLIFHPKFSLLKSVFAIDQIWQANQENANTPTAKIFIDNTTYLYVTREDLAVVIYNINYSEYVFLEELQKGNSYGSAAKVALDIDKNLNIQDLLLKHLVSGTFTEFKIG